MKKSSDYPVICSQFPANASHEENKISIFPRLAYFNYRLRRIYYMLQDSLKVRLNVGEESRGNLLWRG